MRFISTLHEEAAAYADAYLRTLSGDIGAVYASIRLTDGAFYRVVDGDENIGLINVSGTTLNAMTLNESRLADASEVFAAAKAQFALTQAVVYPHDDSVLTAASLYRPTVEPLSYTYRYIGGPAQSATNPYKPLTEDWMRCEAELAKVRCEPFARHELHVETDETTAEHIPYFEKDEIKNAIRERRVFTLTDGRAVGLIRPVPHSRDKWDIAVYVDPLFRRRGIGSALLKILAQTSLDYGRMPLGLTHGDAAIDAFLRAADFAHTATTVLLKF